MKEVEFFYKYVVSFYRDIAKNVVFNKVIVNAGYCFRHNSLLTLATIRYTFWNLMRGLRPRKSAKTVFTLFLLSTGNSACAYTLTED